MSGLGGSTGIAPGGARQQITGAAGLGYRAVQLDAAAQGTRPRELDRSARRDLGAMFRRLGLELSGLDLWIPPAHFADPANTDRAVSAVGQAAALASELAALGVAGEGARGRVVSVVLPEKCPEGVLAHLGSACETHGVLLADHAWPARADTGHGAVRVGFDPGAVIFAGKDPIVEAAGLSPSPASARMTDMSPSGRVEPGSGLGRLDRAAYEAALHAAGYRGHLVVDLRGLPDVPGAAKRLAPPPRDR